MTPAPSHTSAYLWPSVGRFVSERDAGRVFEIGCGNGATAAFLAEMGCAVVGIDIDPDAVVAAESRGLTGAQFMQRSIYDDGMRHFYAGAFGAIVALEVIEHCPDSWGFMAAVRDLLDGDGRALISTPYHGWLKNVCIAASGRHDRHFDPLWRGGHLKFFSVATMTRLCEESGLRVVRVERVGRIAPLAKSMIFTLAKR